MRSIVNIFFLLVQMAILLSCNKDSRQDWTGMEYFEFKISGVVTDNVGSPIQGISVSACGFSVKTSSDGTYLLEGTGEDETEVFVNFSDVDGAENGGRYMGTSVNVNLGDGKGSHGPYLGLFVKENVNVSLLMGLTPMPDSDIPL